MHSYKLLLLILTTVSCTLFLGGAILLFLRTNGNRARYLLAWVMLLWGVGFTIQLVSRLSGSQAFVNRDFFSPIGLVIGNFYALLYLPYIVEVVRPGWLNWRRLLLIIAPYLLILFFYFALSAFLQQSAVELKGPEDLWQHISLFNVWFRFVIFTSVIIYLIMVHGLIFHCQSKYRKWCRENYSSTERMKINWLHYFEIALYLLTGMYFLLVFVGTPVTFIIQQIALQLTFAFVLYKGLFHENPYPEGFFKISMRREEEEMPKTVLEDSGFVKKLPDYVLSLKLWLETEKPYLNPDFKLLDVGSLLPLNRSYLSRIFNEGMGAPFNQVVQHYRIAEAKRLLIEDKSIKINDIAIRSGFSSHAAFHHAFVKQNGITPNMFRKNS